MDSGYYFGQANLSTPADIDRKIAEFRDRPFEPLLLSSRSLELQFASSDYETNMDHLYSLEEAYVIPSEKNAPLTFEKIVTYVRSHYVKGPMLAGDRMQIWYPIATSSR
jgi:hypothetical protein